MKNRVHILISTYASLDGNLSRFQVHGVVGVVLLYSLCGDVAPFVEDVGGVVFQLERDESLVVRAVHFFRAAIGKIWWEGGGEVSMVFLSFLPSLILLLHDSPL